jgi:flavin-dependent dehydrogenase
LTANLLVRADLHAEAFLISQRPDYDVAVIGGGPAGSSAAAHLARQGRRVVLFERDSFPRFHIGESLLASVNAPLEALGLGERMCGMGFPEKWGASFLSADGCTDRYFGFDGSSLVPQPRTWEVERSRFDEMLLDHAAASGADLRQPCRVLDVELSQDGATLAVQNGGARHAVRAAGVIDASGRMGIIARRHELRVEEPTLANIAFFSHYSGVPRPIRGRPGDIRIVPRDDLGWFWLIPISQELTSVGVVLPRKVYDTWPREEPPHALDRAIADTPIVSLLLSGARREWPVRVERDYSYSVRAYAGDRWLLAGDAGAFLDPVFSTGVAIALESGVDASIAMGAALDDEGARRKAFDRFNRRSLGRYRAFHRFVTGFYAHRFRRVLLAPSPPPAVLRAIVTLLAGHWELSLEARAELDTFYRTAHVPD